MESNIVPLVPEGLAQSLELLDLPCLPPLPLEYLDLLEETAPFFFATDSRDVWRMDYPEDRDSILSPDMGDESALPAPRYVGFGLVGAGLQDKHFLYLLDVPGLRLGLSLPWGSAYGDPQKERVDLEAALRIAHACQRNITEFGTLRVFLAEDQCLWDYEENGVAQSGEGVASLLDHLTVQVDSASAELPSHLWMRV
jgi:hypothetical protein